MGKARDHALAVVHLTDKRAVDIINCNDVNNRSLLEDYCNSHDISFMYCNSEEAIRLLVSIGGYGLGVYTNADTDDINECLQRKALAKHRQRELLAVLGAWVIVEPIDLEFSTGQDKQTIIIS